MASFLKDVIENNEYQIQAGQVQWTEESLSKIQTLCNEILDYCSLLSDEKDTTEKKETDGQLLGGLLGQYLQAQIYRYHMILTEGLIPDEAFDEKFKVKGLQKQNFSLPLNESEKTQAIDSLKAFPSVVEANTLIIMRPTPFLNLNYSDFFYAFGNDEEYQAHTNGYQNELDQLNQQIDKLASSDPRNERSGLLNQKTKAENSLKLMTLGRKYSQLVQQVNQLPMNPEIVKQRLSLFIPLNTDQHELSKL